MERWTLTYYNNKIVASERYVTMHLSGLILQFPYNITADAIKVYDTINGGCSMGEFELLLKRLNLSYENTDIEGLRCFRLKRRP